MTPFSDLAGDRDEEALITGRRQDELLVADPLRFQGLLMVLDLHAHVSSGWKGGPREAHKMHIFLKLDSDGDGELTKEGAKIIERKPYFAGFLACFFSCLWGFLRNLLCTCCCRCCCAGKNEAVAARLLKLDVNEDGVLVSSRCQRPWWAAH